MKLSRQDLGLLCAGALIVAAGVGLALWRDSATRAVENPRPLTSKGLFPDLPNKPDKPKLLGFKGDLELGGLPGPNEELNPFVVGEILALNVESVNTTEFHWTLNDTPLPFEGKEWSRHSTREFHVTEPGSYQFKVQGRTGEILTPPLQKTIDVVAAKIETFEPEFIPLTIQDRYLVGESISLAAEMVEPMMEVPYLFRFFLNGKPILHPEDKKVWTTHNALPFRFDQPGAYQFKVEVRRATSDKVEDSLELAKVIRAGYAVIDFFDVSPESATPGTPVFLDAIPKCLSAVCECRFGIRDLGDSEADFQWLPTEKGAPWGGDRRIWTPEKPGVYKIRTEVRRVGQKKFDDFWEISAYTVVEGKDDF